jgi:hypothetical protein
MVLKKNDNGILDKNEIIHKILKRDLSKYNKLISELEEKITDGETLAVFKELRDLIEYEFHLKHAKVMGAEHAAFNEVINYIFEENCFAWCDFGVHDLMITSKTKKHHWVFIDPKSALNDKESYYLMFIECIKKTQSYINACNNKKEVFNKRKLVEVCYQSLRDYYVSDRIKKRKSNLLSHYKLTVITGLIIIHLKPDPFASFEESIREQVPLKPSEIKNVLSTYVAKHSKKYKLGLS